MLQESKNKFSAIDTVHIVFSTLADRNEYIKRVWCFSLQKTVFVTFIAVKTSGLVTTSGNSLNRILSGEGSGYGVF